MDNKGLIKPFVIMNKIENDEENKPKELIKAFTLTEDSPLRNIKKPFEEKKYLIFYIAIDDDGYEYKSFEMVTGRTAAYDFIKGMASSLNMHESMILVEGVPLEDATSVYNFIIHIKQFMPPDSFDIDDYTVGDKESENEYNNTNINNEALNIWNNVASGSVESNNNEYNSEVKYEENEDGEIYV